MELVPTILSDSCVVQFARKLCGGTGSCWAPAAPPVNYTAFRLLPIFVHGVVPRQHQHSLKMANMPACWFIVSHWHVLPVQPQISSFCICHPPYSCQFTFKSSNALHGAHMRPSTNNERQRPRTPSILHLNPSFQRHHDDLHQSVHYRVLMATANALPLYFPC